ncbi:1135_t:CDS:10 [Entrophospora sp. SA101]|nr:14369_t:CDS:10 [Entrophospora sp. SA101]CAJ0896684.1 1135_t:CDS:10 [Entrophospora sp. SA101]
MVRLTRSKAAMNYGQTIKEEDDSSRSVIKGKRSRKKIIESNFTRQIIRYMESNTLSQRRKSKIENHEYRDEDDFVNDMDLMFNNAKRYNVEGSQIYDDAVTLSKLVYKLIGGKFENEENQTYKILQEIEYKGETYFVGEYVHIYNEYDNEKPHIVHIYKLWENNKGLKGLYGCYYYRAEQTKHNLWQKFYDNEVFKTNTFQDHLIHDVLGKCCVINVNDFKTGYPKGFEGKSIYVCESRYNEISKTFNKIKNWSSLTPNDSRAPAIRFEIREIPIVLNKIESPLAAEFKAKRVKKEDSSTSEDIFSPDTNYDSQSDVPTTHSENKITESNNVPLSSARIRITSKKLSGRYKSNSSNLTIPSHHQTKSIPTNIHHNNGMVPSSYGYPNSTHIQQNPSQSHYVMSPFPSSQYYQNQQPHHYHPIGQQFTNQNITTSYTNSFAPLSSSSLQHSQNAMQVPSNVHSKVTNAKSVNINISSSQATNGQEILKSFQEPKHSEKYIKHREEIIARNKKRLREIEEYNDNINKQNKKQATKIPQVNEADLLKTVQELSNIWKNDAIILNQRLNQQENTDYNSDEQQ